MKAMNPKREEQIAELFDQVFASQIVLNAKVDVLRMLVEQLAEKQGLQGIDGLSIAEWFEAERKDQMLTRLIELGDRLGDPGYVARLTEMINSAK
jgi:hypothetical protein